MTRFFLIIVCSSWRIYYNYKVIDKICYFSQSATNNHFMQHRKQQIIYLFIYLQIKQDYLQPNQMNRFTKRFFLLLVLLIGIDARSQYKVANYTCSSVACTFNLTYTGDGDYFKTPKSPIVKNLFFTFKGLTFMDFTFKFVDPNKSRFQWPQGRFQENVFPQDPYANFSFPLQSASYEFSYNLDPFSFKIVRLSTNYTIFSTIGQEIVFSEHYLQIGTPIQSDFIYGLGERFVNSFRVRNGKWTIFNRDHPFQIDHGDGQQTYGHYPYYINREKFNFYHFAYFRNSNAMDVIKEQISGKTTLTFKTIGGIIDFRFILGDRDPTVLLAKWNNYAERSNTPPFWSLGFHQCRWGYENSSMLLDVLSNYQKNGIPLDTIWSDIDYMEDFEDFSIDEDRFPLSDMATIKNKYRYVPIIDAGIKINGFAYQQGLKRNVFVKDALGQIFIGQVWPGKTAFVDFFHPNATQYWSDMLGLLYQKIQFDGVWLDMNELSNFCNGPCEVPQTPSVFDFTNDLPYHPGKDVIETSTIPLNCTHYNGLQQADVHDFHGYLQTRATFSFLRSKNLRPFIVSRSSTIGSSGYGNHWTGDNAATWQFLQGSISNIFNGHINGFKMVGEDICGFAGETTVQLCSRWFQLGSLYPFSRSHNIIGQPSQQPYALGDIVLKASTKAIKLRYSLLKSLYTYMMKEKHSFIWAPLFFVYPNNDLLYNDQIADTTFILMESLLVTPILEQGKTSRSVYFPENDWYDLFSGKRYLGNSTSTINCSLTDTIPIFLSEGYNLLLQDVDKIVNTDQLSSSFQAYSALTIIRQESGLDVYSANSFINSFANYSDYVLVNPQDDCRYAITIELYIESSGNRYLKVKSFTSSVYQDPIKIQSFNLYYEKGTIRFSPTEPVYLNRQQQTVPIPKSAYQTQQVSQEPNLRIE